MEKKRNKKKIIGLSILSIFFIGIVASVIAYNQLQPKNHFKSVPVLNSPEQSDVEESTSPKKEVEENKVEIEKPIFNVLLIGSDQRKGSKIGHTDSMIMVHVDLTKNEYHLLSIPRDTRIYLENYGFTKLTSVQYILQAHKGAKQGIEEAVKTVGNFTGVPINYYVEVNYWGLQDIVDELGGINVDVSFDVELTHPWYPENANKVITEGKQFLDGKMVTELVHERYSLENGDYGRQQLQQVVLAGLAQTALDPKNISKLPKLVNSVSELLVATNMETSDMLSLGLSVKDFDPNSQIHNHQLYGQGKTMYDDILQAKNSQIVVDENKMNEIVNKYFLNSR